MNKRIKNALPIAIAILASACSSNYLIQSEYITEDIAEPEASIIEGATFSEDMKEVKIIAVKAPDFCVNQSASKTSGSSTQDNQVLKTNCGVEMALIEKSLAKSGFIVVSWKVLQNAVSSSHASVNDTSQSLESRTPLEAAAALKADALFQINSLETSISLAKTNARWSRTYFKSNEYGEAKKPAEITDTLANQLDTVAVRSEKEALSQLPRRLSSTVDASVTLVKNGQAIWFYDWNHSGKAPTMEKKTDTLVTCKGSCWEIRKQKRQAGSNMFKTKETMSGRSSGISSGRSTADMKAAIHNQLLKEIISDMVNKYSLGTTVSKK